MNKCGIITICLLLLICKVSVGQSAYTDSLQAIINLGRHDDAERKAYSLLAIHYFKSNPEKARRIMLQQVESCIEAKDYLRLSAAYTLLLSIHQDAGNMDSAGAYLSKLSELASSIPDLPKVQGNCNQAIGLYYNKKGDYKAALPYALNAVKYAELGSSSDKAYIGGQWLNAADVYSGLGQYNNAMNCYLKSLRLFEESGSKRGEGFCYTNMATLYNSMKQYSNALRSAQKSLEIKTELKDNRGICTALEAIGQAHMNMNNFQPAFTSYQQALKIALAEKMPSNEMTCYFNMAKIYAAQDKDSLAALYYKKSKEIAVQTKNKSVEAYANTELSVLNKSADSLKQAEKTLTTSLQTFKEAGSLEREIDNYKKLAEYYTANSQYDKALLFTDKYHALKDSITGADVQVQFKKLEEQFNSEKKEKEINLLKKDKELQQQKIKEQRLLMFGSVMLALLAFTGIWLLRNRNKLRQKMKELELRNQIAADLHDEVGSSLSSINMLSQMAAQPGNEAMQKGILQRMSTNAKETMEKMSDLVWTIKPEEAEGSNLKQRMERFAYEICGAKNIDLSLELDKLDTKDLTMDQRKNMYLIFKEALNNAVKYSGTEKINVSAANGQNILTMIVKDEGKGFDTGIVIKGNGLDNIKNRSAGIGGKLDIDSAPGKGTIVKLTMPLKI